MIKKTSLIIIVLLLFSCSQKKKKNAFSIKGSDTMIHLVSQWVETYIEQKKDKSEKVSISVTGGGSGNGIAALLNNTTEICAASRNVQPRELRLAKRKGLIIKERTVAIDGISIIVNPENTIEALTLKELEGIYTGEYTHWNQLGGIDEKIIVLARESSSGTYIFFQEKALNKKDYSPKALLLPANSAILQTVSKDRGAIGYVGYGYYKNSAGNVKAIAIKQGNVSVMPTYKTIINNKYPLSRNLFFYTTQKSNPLIEDFIQYVWSSQGQKQVQDAGYISIK